MSTALTQSSHAVPHKATLYWNPTSAWSTVRKLALYEMNYNPEDVALETVDISKGDNFSPDYRRINHNGTIPTLVVPILDPHSSPKAETEYRSFNDTLSILAYLDSARPTLFPPSTSNSSFTPPPSPPRKLSPATMEGQTRSDSLILAVHLPNADPNFLLVSARTAHELVQKEAGFPGQWLKRRREALLRYLDEEEEGKEARGLLERKLEANESIYQIYYSSSQTDATEERRRLFFSTSLEAWSVGVPGVLQTLEEEIVGPFALGEDVSLADLHIIAWLARLVFLSQGGPDLGGLSSLERQIHGPGSSGVVPSLEGFRIGRKVRKFWEEWSRRVSFRRVYVSDLS